MVALYPVGKSSFGDGSGSSPRGKTQYVLSPSVAAQVASLAVEFDKWAAKKPGRPRLTVNEGVRSRERQDALYAQYRRDGAPLAALPYTSTHDQTRGSALDFGVTYEDGSNGALASVDGALRWMQLNGPTRGIRPTGLGFWQPESWHYNGGYAPTRAPIKNAPQPGSKTTTKPPAAAKPARRKDRDMDIKWANDHKSALLIAGSDRTMVDARSPKIDGLTGLEQARLWERACRLDVDQPWGGKGKELGKGELQNLAHIMGAVKKGYAE